MDLLASVRQTIRRHALACADTRLVVALSGGSDSVALAYLLRELETAGDLKVAGVAHFNHQLRDTAGRDEALAAAVARDLGWLMCAGREDVRARARRERRSIEHAARGARLAFFERARVELGADCVAVGHTLDDQAETFLLRLLRGAGPRGLAAIHPRNGAIVRPLLDCRRVDLREYLHARHIEFVEDESNRDVSIPRNRIRIELMPLLERRFNPSIASTLADAATLARDEWLWMVSEADGLVAQATGPSPPLTPESVALDVVSLMTAPVGLRRLALWRAMEVAANGHLVGFEAVERAMALLEPGAAGEFDAPGQRVERAGAWLVLRGRPPGASGRLCRTAVNLFRYPLSIPGEAVVPEAGCVVVTELRPSAGTRHTSGTMATVRSDVRGPLAVRNRRPGDSFTPLGLGGRKKLQDYFVDRKIARADRDRIPLIVDAEDRIVWIGGHAIDEAFRVPEFAQSMLLLRLKLVGGPA